MEIKTFSIDIKSLMGYIEIEDPRLLSTDIKPLWDSKPALAYPWPVTGKSLILRQEYTIGRKRTLSACHLPRQGLNGYKTKKSRADI